MLFYLKMKASPPLRTRSDSIYFSSVPLNWRYAQIQTFLRCGSPLMDPIEYILFYFLYERAS